MIREIKLRKNKFGTIISAFEEGVNTRDDAANLESMNAYSAFVTIHTKGKTREVANGVNYIGYKSTPKLKQAVGHHIAQIRGDQLVAFVLPSMTMLEDITRVYAFADANRMERAYGFFLGEPNKPSLVAISGPIVPHLFHSIPDQMDMTGEAWLQWIHEWAPKTMMQHRYFNANQYCNVATKRIVVDEPVVVGGIAVEVTDAEIPAISQDELSKTEKRNKAWDRRLKK